MTTIAAVLLIGGTSAVALVALFVVRRLAGPGGLYGDGSMAAAVYGVVGSAFAVLLAFVIFIGFSSYREAEANAASEAVAVRQMFRVAGLFELDDGAVLRADLVCYARSVIGLEWEAMESEQDSDVVDLWLDRFEVTLTSADVSGPRSQIALGQWLSQAAIRQEGRRGRISEASPVVAPFVWVVLILAGVIVIAMTVCSPTVGSASRSRGSWSSP